MQEQIINILLFACTANVWANELTKPTGLLERLPLLWRKSALLTKLLSCSVCVAGWSSIIYNISIQAWWDIFPVAVFSMVTAKLIESKIYQNGRF